MNNKAEVSWFLVSMISATFILLVGAGLYASPIKTWRETTNSCEATGIGMCTTAAECDLGTGVVMRESCKDKSRICCMTEGESASSSAGSVQYLLYVDNSAVTSTNFELAAEQEHTITIRPNSGENLAKRTCAITFLYNDGTLKKIDSTRTTFACSAGTTIKFKPSADLVKYSPIDFDFVAFPTDQVDWNALSDSTKMKVAITAPKTN